jgi:hypothetical protein
VSTTREHNTSAEAQSRVRSIAREPASPADSGVFAAEPLFFLFAFLARAAALELRVPLFAPRRHGHAT